MVLESYLVGGDFLFQMLLPCDFSFKTSLFPTLLSTITDLIATLVCMINNSALLLEGK